MANEFVSSITIDDTLFLNSLSNDLVNGWVGQVTKLDREGSITKIDSVFSETINNFTWGGKSSRLICYGTFEKSC